MSKVEKKLIYKEYEVVRKLPINYKKGELDFCKDEFKYITFNTYLQRHRLSFVNNSGQFFHWFCKLDVSTLVHHSYKPSQKLILYRLWKRKKKLFFDNNYYLVAFDEWSCNHYHWVCDFLPKLWAIKEEIHHYVLVLPDAGYIREVGIKFFNILKFNPQDVIYIKPNELFFFKNLTRISSTSQTGRTNDILISGISEFIRNRYRLKPPVKMKKVYVSREGAKNRKVLNETDVVQFLKARNFEIIKFEKLTLEEQLLLAYNTTLLISIHGAGLTNMVAMPKGSAVIEFRRDVVYHNQCYWHLADSVGLNYYYFFGTPDSDQVIEGSGCNLFICTTKLGKLLDTIDSL